MKCSACGRPLEHPSPPGGTLCHHCDDPARHAVRAAGADDRRLDQFSPERAEGAREAEPASKPPPSIRVVRPVWVYLVAGVYLTVLLALLLLPVWVASQEPPSNRGPTGLFLFGVVVVLFLLGLSLVVIPIGEVRRRPAGRTPIVFTIIGSSLCAGLLVWGGSLALYELAFPPGTRSGPVYDTAGWMTIAAPLLVWLGWAGFFSWLAFSAEPLSLADRANKWLLGGSVLELLVAILSHVIVRRRAECCAGMLTGLGIILGTAIMIVALGPGVFFLFYRRYQQTYRRPVRSQRDEDHE
jgi:hypothetical protein